MKKVISYILWIAVVLLAIKLVAIAIAYFNFETDYEFLKQKQDLIHNKTWLVAFYLHLLGGGVAVLTGTALFFTRWIKPSSKLHKFMGKIYFISIMFVGGPTGLYLAFYAESGYLATIGFIGMSAAWMVTTFVSVAKITKGDVKGHYKWTIRSYATTLAGVTLRIMTGLGIEYLHWDYDTTFLITAYVPWLMNLGFAEIVILLKSKSIDLVSTKYAINKQ